MKIRIDKDHKIIVGTLSREDSRVWAGKELPDARDLYEVRGRNRQKLEAAMRRHGSLEGYIYASERHGGCLLDVIGEEAEW